MADATDYGNKNSASKGQCVPCVICDEYATNNALANSAQIIHCFDGGSLHRHRGVSNPPGPASGRQSAQDRGGAHAPAPSETPAQRVSCAAQNAALVDLPLSLQVVGVERVAREALADTDSSIIGFD